MVLTSVTQVRGGGGGTFGIVTSAVYKTHPPTPITIVAGARNGTITAAQIVTVTNALAKIAVALGDLGVGGIFTASGPTGALLILALPNGNIAQLVAGRSPFCYIWILILE